MNKHVYNCRTGTVYNTLYYYIHDEQSTGPQHNKQGNPITTLFFREKASQVGIKPTTLCSLDECSTTELLSSTTELYTKAAQRAGPKSHNTIQQFTLHYNTIQGISQ